MTSPVGASFSRRIRRATATLTLAAAFAAGACGASAGSSAAPSHAPQASTASPSAPTAPVAATSPAAPQPAPSPQITSGLVPKGALNAVRVFWRLVGARRLAQVRASLAPGSPLADPGTRWDIKSARLVHVSPMAHGTVPPYATVLFSADVYIAPASGQGAWGSAGVHTLWMTVTRTSDGSWRVYEFGTGP